LQNDDSAEEKALNGSQNQFFTNFYSFYISIDILDNFMNEKNEI